MKKNQSITGLVLAFLIFASFSFAWENVVGDKNYTGRLNIDGTSKFMIDGTAVDATAAQLNQLNSGSITATFITNSGNLFVGGEIVTTNVVALGGAKAPTAGITAALITLTGKGTNTGAFGVGGALAVTGTADIQGDFTATNDVTLGSTKSAAVGISATTITLTGFTTNTGDLFIGGDIVSTNEVVLGGDKAVTSSLRADNVGITADTLFSITGNTTNTGTCGIGGVLTINQLTGVPASSNGLPSGRIYVSGTNVCVVP